MRVLGDIIGGFMAKLNRLIKGQDVAFDTHQSGDGQEVHWKYLHLEKRLHGGRGKLKFPLFGDQVPTKPENMSSDDYDSVVSEVRKALKKNKELVTQLAKTVSAEMKRFSSNKIDEKNAIDAVNKLAKYFDLDESFFHQMVNNLNDIIELQSYHFDPVDHLAYQVTLSKNGAEVKTARIPDDILFIRKPSLA